MENDAVRIFEYSFCLRLDFFFAKLPSNHCPERWLLDFVCRIGGRLYPCCISLYFVYFFFISVSGFLIDCSCDCGIAVVDFRVVIFTSGGLGRWHLLSSFSVLFG